MARACVWLNAHLVSGMGTIFFFAHKSSDDCQNTCLNITDWGSVNSSGINAFFGADDEIFDTPEQQTFIGPIFALFGLKKNDLKKP